MLGASNKPIRWGEAVRIADLKPDIGTAPRHPNRPREALDAASELHSLEGGRVEAGDEPARC